MGDQITRWKMQDLTVTDQNVTQKTIINISITDADKNIKNTNTQLAASKDCLAKRQNVLEA